VGFPKGNDAYYINYQFTAVAGQDAAPDLLKGAAIVSLPRIP
jgi:hypothetical protein